MSNNEFKLLFALFSLCMDHIIIYKNTLRWTLNHFSLLLWEIYLFQLENDGMLR